MECNWNYDVIAQAPDCFLTIEILQVFSRHCLWNLSIYINLNKVCLELQFDINLTVSANLIKVKCNLKLNIIITD